MRGARLRQPLSPFLLRIGRQAPRDGAVESAAIPASSRTRRLSSLLAGSMIRASTRWRKISSPPAAFSNPSTRYACCNASSRCPIREDVIGSGLPPAGSRPRPSSSWPTVSRCRAAAFSVSSPASSCAKPRCSISREPRRDEYTICTAVAPNFVFTVLTYGTKPLYGHR